MFCAEGWAFQILTLISGFIDDGLADLTAMVCEKRQIHNRRGEFDQDKEEFWKYLNTMK